MTRFLEDLWKSIFTPGPTPTLLTATNATFAALQVLLFILLLATYSVHFAVLSLLSAGLWWSINWFATELQAAKTKEGAERESRSQTREPRPPEIDRHREESDTETEVSPPSKTRPNPASRSSGMLVPEDAGTPARKRLSLGENSGYISTDSEWEKVDESDEKNQ